MNEKHIGSKFDDFLEDENIKIAEEQVTQNLLDFIFDKEENSLGEVLGKIDLLMDGAEEKNIEIILEQDDEV